MPQKRDEELCAIIVFRKVWKMLKGAESLETARTSFKELILKLILEE